MTIQQLLLQGTAELEKVGIETARLDCLILLAYLVGKDKSWLLAHLDFKLNEEQEAQYVATIEQRKQHVPIAYIIGRSEFYGLTFLVTGDTLQPRPETETMIELIASLPKKPNTVLIDVGTGTGCIAITTKKTFPALAVFATDISEPALAIARKNAELHEVNITFAKGNLVEPALQSLDSKNLSEIIICANLPYVPNTHPLNTAATHEPELALFGGVDGLDLFRELFAQIDRSPNLKVPILLFTECLEKQQKSLENIAQTYGFSLKKKDGLIQYFYK